MPKSVTGIEMLAFGAVVLAVLAVVGLLFAVSLSTKRPKDGPASDSTRA